MKTIAILVAMILGACVQAQTENNGSISAIVTNVAGTEGNVKFGLYTAETFMKAEPDYGIKAEILDGKAIAVFKNIPQGTYALLVMHDVNDNGKMDFDANGIPLESFGASGNGLSYGPPSWQETKFDFTGDSTKMELRF